MLFRSSFNATSGSITFAAGASTAVLLLDPSSDSASELTEDISLSLLSGAGYAVASTDAVVTYLLDNDSGSGAMAGAAIPPRLATGTAFEMRNTGAFAALKRDGSVVTWGNELGGADSSAVASQLAGGVVKVYSNGFAFAALKRDGSVISWGDGAYGGDSSAVASQLTSGVTQIASNATAFAALKSDGSVVPWGSATYGNFGGSSSALRAQLAANVKQVFA